MEVLYSFFNLGARLGGWSRLRSGHFTPEKEIRYSFYKRLSGTQCRCGRVRKIPPAPGFDLRIFQAIASRYTDYAILTRDLIAVRLISYVSTWQLQWAVTFTSLFEMVSDPRDSDAKRDLLTHLYTNVCGRGYINLPPFNEGLFHSKFLLISESYQILRHNNRDVSTDTLMA